ncbi:hypothetical protein [Streptomyces sp. CB00316]|uniref:LexA family protein n=1 Tax=Streptomyces sp. CB00316 TaxID=1703932 RepID=UPI0009A0E789
MRFPRRCSSWLTDHGHGPTVREIGERVGLSSTGSVAHQLGQLEERGLIRTGARVSWARSSPPANPGCGAGEPA